MLNMMVEPKITMGNLETDMFVETVNTEVIKETSSSNILNYSIQLNTSDSLNGTLPIDMQFNAGHILSISVYSVLLVLSSIGNLTVLTAILRRKCYRKFFSRIDLLLVHLAIADLMVTFFMMPLEIGWAATVQWKAGDGMCRIMAFFRIFGLYLSGFVLVCLAIDRYMAVRYPMQGLASTKRAKLMVGIAWLLSIICSVPQVFIFHVERHPVHTWYTQCVTYNVFTKPEYELFYNVFVMVMMYALPFILLVGLYGSIAVELWRVAHSAGSTFGSADGLRRSGVDNIERAKVKSIQMTLVITAAFLICWTPYYVMCVWYWTDPESAKNVDQRIQKGLFLFACTNSTVNPIVYGIFHLKAIFGKNTSRRPRASSVSNRTSTTNIHRVSTQLIHSTETSPCNRTVFGRIRFGQNEASTETRCIIYKGTEGECVPLLITKHAVGVTSRL